MLDDFAEALGARRSSGFGRMSHADLLGDASLPCICVFRYWPERLLSGTATKNRTADNWRCKR